MQNGIIIAVPNPNPVGEEIESEIRKALAAADQKGVAGNELTPFVLKYIHETTKGKSLDANISLIKRNAQVASQIASSLKLI